MPQVANVSATSARNTWMTRLYFWTRSTRLEHGREEQAANFTGRWRRPSRLVRSAPGQREDDHAEHQDPQERHGPFAEPLVDRLGRCLEIHRSIVSQHR